MKNISKATISIILIVVLFCSCGKKADNITENIETTTEGVPETESETFISQNTQYYYPTEAEFLAEFEKKCHNYTITERKDSITTIKYNDCYKLWLNTLPDGRIFGVDSFYVTYDFWGQLAKMDVQSSQTAFSNIMVAVSYPCTIFANFQKGEKYEASDFYNMIFVDFVDNKLKKMNYQFNECAVNVDFVTGPHCSILPDDGLNYEERLKQFYLEHPSYKTSSQEYSTEEYTNEQIQENIITQEDNTQSSIILSDTYMCVNAEGGLRMREKQSTDSKKILTIPDGETVWVNTMWSNGWSHITYNEHQGYCSNTYLEFPEKYNDYWNSEE